MSDDPADVLKRRLASLPARLRQAASVRLGGVAEAMVADLRARLSQAGDTARSAPDGVPRDLHGRIAESLVVGTGDGEALASVSATDPVAGFLEYGTRQMAARPFLRPAGERARPAALAACREALAAAAEEIR